MSPTLPPLKIDYSTFLKDHFVLPPLSTTVLQVIQVMQSETGGASEVAKLISRDAAMVSHILKVVNSAYYALPKQIGNVQHAIAYIGLGEVSRICLALSVINVVKPGSKKELHHFWLHSYLTAVIAKRLIRGFPNAAGVEDLYAAALLHDIGELVYQRFFPDYYREMREYCSTYKCFLADAEEHFGFPSHQTFGACLSEHWTLPATIKRACEFHELRDLKTVADKSQATPFDLVIAVSNLIAYLAKDPLEERLKEEVTTEVRRILGASKEEFLRFLADVYELDRTTEAQISQMI